jgi:hypothetical protein
MSAKCSSRLLPFLTDCVYRANVKVHFLIRSLFGKLTIGKAIKIFGVYTHAQIGRVSFWDTMGRELGKKGKEYKDR